MMKHDFQAISMDISYGPTFHREMHMYQVEDLTMEVTFFHFCIHLLCNNYFYNYVSSWNFQECWIINTYNNCHCSRPYFNQYWQQ